MTVPGWWNERRYGLRLHASIATVPSFGAIGESADWYWCHLGSDALHELGPHPRPMPEVLAHHRDRWSHVDRYDDFMPFLSFHRFDADEQIELARDAGARFVVHTVKDKDGFCWWEAPATKRTSVLHGPQRDVTGEIAAACRRHGVLFGTSYSLVDWSDARSVGAVHPSDVFTTEVLQPQVLDLVERYGTHVLMDGERHRAPRQLTELIDRVRDLADAQGIEIALDDGWGVADPSFATLDRIPDHRVDALPWVLNCSLGPSRGHNRTERAEHLLSTGALFDLLTEVVAKGGHLLIDVGPSIDGTISEIQQQPLREVGAWVHDHPDVIHGSRPFDEWGDAQIRYMNVGDDLVAVDLSAGPEVALTALTPERYEVASIHADDGGSVHWEQHRGGVIVSRIDRSPTGLAGAYRIRLRPVAQPIRLFDEREFLGTLVQPMLDSAVAGDVVQLQDGRFLGPISIPDGVTLRGTGWDRSSLVRAGMVRAGVVGTDQGGDPTALVTLGVESRIENIHVVDSRPAPGLAVRLVGERSGVAGCRCDGQIAVEADDASVEAVIGTRITSSAERTNVEHCALRGSRWDIGVLLSGGSGHRIHHNELVEHLASVRLTDVSASTVSENRFDARWWGVHLQQCDHVEVVDNDMQHTMRAVDVDGGNGSVITGNWVADGDSGAVVSFGATDTSVIDNHVERCRIGVLVWDAPTSMIGPNTFVDLHEEDPVVHGPDADTD